MATIENIISFLIEHGHQRNTTLLAVGGGVVGDITGLVSALYLRGINFVYVPTTLLAQVDATLGGKCAVNHPLGKNLIGTFYHPSKIIIDTHTLATLPEREYKSGLAEVVKHAIALDKNFFIWLEQYTDQIKQRDPQIVNELIYKSLSIKKSIVEQDEKDRLDVRALLNFGHTFGHALEKATNHQLLHGEAVAIGMKLATQLSFNLHLISEEESTRIIALINNLATHLSINNFKINTTVLMKYLSRDKKNEQTNKPKIKMILLENIGNSIIKELEWSFIYEYIKYFTETKQQHHTALQ